MRGCGATRRSKSSSWRGESLDPTPVPGEEERFRRDQVHYFMDNHFGRVMPLALAEIVPTSDPAMSIDFIRANPMCEHLVLFTNGMSERPMTVPKGGESFRFAELVMFLPPDWPLTDEALKDRRYCSGRLTGCSESDVIRTTSVLGYAGNTR